MKKAKNKFLYSLLTISCLQSAYAFPTPDVISPLGTTTPQNGQVTFQWRAVADTANYGIGAYPVNEQGKIIWTAILDKAITPEEAGCSNDELCSISQLISVDSAVWKIRAVSISDQVSNYTEYHSFSVNVNEPPPELPAFSTPVIVAPIDLTSPQNGLVTFQWQAVAETASYGIGAYPVDEQGKIIWVAILDKDVTPEQAGCSDGGVCSIYEPIAVNSAIWKIRAVSLTEVVSDYTDYQSFNLNAIDPPFCRKAFPDYFPAESDSWKIDAATSMTGPNYLASKIDPDTNLPVYRLGGEPYEMGVTEFTLPSGNGGSNEALSEGHGQHFYSRTNPVNKNETFALGKAGGRGGGAALWNLSSKNLVAWVPTGANFSCASCVFQRQLLWDKLQSNVYWYVDHNQLMRAEIDFNTFQVNTTIWKTFDDFDLITFGEGEGDFSDDGKRIVLIGSQTESNESSSGHTIIAYTLGNHEAALENIETRATDTELDWAAIDPTGEYVVLNDADVATYVLPYDLTGQPRLLYNNTKHSDFVVDSRGESWIVYGNYQGIFASKISEPLLKQVWPVSAVLSVDVESGVNPNYQDNAENTTASGHISRVSGLPGVVLISRNIDGGLYFLNIDNPAGIVYAGNTRHGRRTEGSPNDSIADLKWGVDYYGEIIGTKAREPRGSASSSGKYLFFVSDYFIYGSNYKPNPVSEPDYEPSVKAFLNMIELDTH